MIDDIDEFKGCYAFLSNFYASAILHESAVYPTAEHLFQAFKTHDRCERERIRTAATPAAAKRLGRRATLRGDWHDVRDSVMEYVVTQKFAQNPHLAELLLATVDARLVEGNGWGDTYWGVDRRTGRGRNRLGLILEDVRG